MLHTILKNINCQKMKFPPIIKSFKVTNFLSKIHNLSVSWENATNIVWHFIIIISHNSNIRYRSWISIYYEQTYLNVVFIFFPYLFFFCTQLRSLIKSRSSDKYITFLWIWYLLSKISNSQKLTMAYNINLLLLSPYRQIMHSLCKVSICGILLVSSSGVIVLTCVMYTIWNASSNWFSTTAKTTINTIFSR